MNKSFLPLLVIALLTGSIIFTQLIGAKEEKADVTIAINGTDTMMYDKTAFEVKSGQKV